MEEFNFGRGRKPFTHNYAKRLRSQSSIADETIEEEQVNIQNHFELDVSVEEYSDLPRTTFEPILNNVETSESDILDNTEKDSFFKDYLMGAKLIQGDTIKVS